MANPLPSVTELEMHDLAMLWLPWETAYKVLNYKAPKTPAVRKALAQLFEALPPFETSPD